MIIHPELPPHRDLYDPASLDLLKTAPVNAGRAAASRLPFLSRATSLRPAIDGRAIAVIGNGQTLSAPGALDDLNRRRDIVKVVAGSTHRLVNDGRLTGVDFAVIGFAGKAMADCIEPQANITYLVAAESDPAVADKLLAANAKVFLYTAHIPELARATLRPSVPVGIGSTAATAALSLFGMLGHNRFEFYGVDSSTTYHDGSKPLGASECMVQAGGKIFVADKSFYEQQTREFEAFARANPHVTMNFHGESLHAALFNTPAPRPAPFPAPFP